SASSYPSIFDTGSNYFYIHDANIANCPSDTTYCPNPTLHLSAIACDDHTDDPTASGAECKPFDFDVANFNSLFANGRAVYGNLAVDGGTSMFIWGLPFFMGRTVYLGLEGSTPPTAFNTLTPPFFAYDQ